LNSLHALETGRASNDSTTLNFRPLRQAQKCPYLEPVDAVRTPRGGSFIINQFEEFTDSQTGMLPGIPRSAMCVQRLDDSLNSAIHITYRISLRSSSLREPRDPLSKVVFKSLITKD
jgi:hypothetical protein